MFLALAVGNRLRAFCVFQVTMGTSQGGDESMELARLRDAVKEGNTQKEQLRKALLYTQTLYEQMQKDKDSHSEMLETQLRQVENLLQESRTEVCAPCTVDGFCRSMLGCLTAGHRTRIVMMIREDSASQPGTNALM